MRCRRIASVLQQMLRCQTRPSPAMHCALVLVARFLWRAQHATLEPCEALRVVDVLGMRWTSRGCVLPTRRRREFGARLSYHKRHCARRSWTRPFLCEVITPRASLGILLLASVLLWHWSAVCADLGRAAAEASGQSSNLASDALCVGSGRVCLLASSTRRARAVWSALWMRWVPLVGAVSVHHRRSFWVKREPHQRHCARWHWVRPPHSCGASIARTRVSVLLLVGASQGRGGVRCKCNAIVLPQDLRVRSEPHQRRVARWLWPRDS